MMWLEFGEITLFLMLAWLIILVIAWVWPTHRLSLKVKRRFSWLTLWAFIIGYLLTYIMLPSLAFPTVIYLIAVVGLIGAGGLILLIGSTHLSGSLNFDKWLNNLSKRRKQPKQINPQPAGVIRLPLTIIGVIISLTLISFVVTAVSNLDVHRMVQTIPSSVSSNSKNAPMPVLNSQHDLPVVNAPKTVLTDMNNSLNSFKNSNVYQLDHLRVQMYHGKMVYVAPVEFDGGFFRYLHYGQTPGYFIASATDKNAEPKFVSHAMRYTPSAYFNNDAIRRIYAQSIGYQLSDNAPQLEIDEHGTPYYVKTLNKRLGWSTNFNYSAFKVAVLNAVTGQVKVYNRKDVPKFVDISVEPSYVEHEVANFGQYQHGFWNATFIGSHKDVLKSAGHGTEGDEDSLTPYAFNGHIYYFTGMTSWSEKQTTLLGYVFVDAHTNEFKYYTEKGSIMTPGRAISYAEQDINPQNYQGNIPLLYRVNGEPTWVVSMLDGQNYSFMKYVYLLANGNNQSGTYAIGTNAKDTLTTLANNLATSNNVKPTQTNQPTKQASGSIFRLTATSDGQYWLMLKGDTTVYNLNAKDGGFQATNRLMQTGDKVKFSYQPAATKNSVAAIKANSFVDQDLAANK